MAEENMLMELLTRHNVMLDTRWTLAQQTH